MKRSIIFLLLSGIVFIPTIFCKTATAPLATLTQDAKKIFTNNTKLYITDIPCTQGNTEVIVRLTCLTKGGAAYFYTPMYTTRNESSGNYSNTYQYDFRKLTEATGCKLTITTITYPHLAHSSYPTTTVQDYYFEVEPTGLLDWVKFW